MDQSRFNSRFPSNPGPKVESLPTETPHPPPQNNYHIYEPIGRGKHSVVYKGRKKNTITYYAIKSVAKDQKPR